MTTSSVIEELRNEVVRIAELERELAAARKDLADVDQRRASLLKHLIATQAELAAHDTAKDAEIAALTAKAARWKSLADLFSIERYGRPCDMDSDIEAWKAALVKPLVEALDTLKGVFCSLCSSCGPGTFALYHKEIAQVDSALAPYKCPTCDGFHEVFDSPSAPCPECKKEAKHGNS